MIGHNVLSGLRNPIGRTDYFLKVVPCSFGGKASMQPGLQIAPGDRALDARSRERHFELVGSVTAN